MSECNCTTPECTCGGTGSVIVKIDHEPVVKILKNRIAALEAANAKQADRIAELEDDNSNLESELDAMNTNYQAVLPLYHELRKEREKLEKV